MSRADLADTACSVARAIGCVGETWTLMILREMFLGSRRFDVLRRNTGASPHILSQRLKQLQADGIIAARQYSAHPPRLEYLLTAKGRDLWPVIVAMRAWGSKWMDPEGKGPPAILTHKGCGAEMEPHLVCDQCGEPIGAADCTARIAPELAAERQRRRKGAA